jgi:hypothetical protein
MKAIAATTPPVPRALALSTALLPLLAAGVLAPEAAGQQPAAGSAVEQTRSATPAPESAAQVFEAAFFKTYNPVTAADMVVRVPGFEIIDGEDRRGFGATAGNVLVNGERPSSKTSISDQLKRIPADSVLRLELISGSSGSADARGQSRLVNVVLKPASSGSSPLTWVAGVRNLQYSDRLGYTLQLSKAFSLSKDIDLSVDIQTPNIRGRTVSTEIVRAANGGLIEYRQQFQQPNFNGVQAAANLKWRASPSDRLSFNALVTPTDNSIGIASVVYLPGGAVRSQTFGRADYTTNVKGEVGGDWEHRVSDEFNVKLIGLATFSAADLSQKLDTFLPAALANTQRQTSSTETGERVGRLSASWTVNDAHTLEFGGEGAFNFRDTTLGLTNQKPGFAPVPVVFAVADTRVEEVRGEVFVTDVWTLSDTLTLESGLTFEASRITQTGDATKEREFTYPKAQIAATWKAGPGNELRASVKRDIAQLDFSEFASSFNSIDATTIVGNPGLEPEKAWKAKVEWDRRFGKKGAFTLGVFHDAVEDVRDLVVIGSNDAYGNIGDGTRTGVELRASLPLDGFGVRGGEFRFNGSYQKTSVTDPLTGETRPFSSGDNATPGTRSGGAAGGPPPLNIGNRDWGYVASYRQDLPELKSAFSISIARNALREEFKRLETITQDRAEERIDLNWDTTAIKGITLRLGYGNVFFPREERVRTFYTPDRRSGVVQRTETRANRGGPDGTMTYTIQASGKF